MVLASSQPLDLWPLGTMSSRGAVACSWLGWSGAVDRVSGRPQQQGLLVEGVHAERVAAAGRGNT